ncbi:hypothetical protein M0802_007757 [Mischocyttarus mexicanus]|nr:hypothetical protein M0802_007757 [Mischocyttarus mexicanus]
MIGTPRRTCRGRPIVCPGPCNHRNYKRRENSCEKKRCHPCSLFNVNENDDDEDDDEEIEEVDVKDIELPARVDEETITNVVLVNVALSQIIISETTNCLKDSDDKAIALCSEQEENIKCPPDEEENTTSKYTDRNKVMPASIGYLLAICIYAIIHFFLAVLAWRESLYEAFISSQACGIAAFIIYQITGTIPL